MKRFGDVLRILSSVLVGAIIKDFDKLRDGLSRWLGDGSTTWWRSAAWWTGAMLIALFVRNIHGSVQYDDWTAKTGFRSSMEKGTGGRALVFAFSIVGLFLGPFLPSHLFAYDFATPNPVPEVGWAIGVLFLSPAVYFLWDVMLFSGRSRGFGDGPQMHELHELLLRWCKIDLVAVGFSFFPLMYFYLTAKPWHLSPSTVGHDFILVAILIIVSDYAWNHSLYFPPAAPDEKTNCNPPLPLTTPQPPSSHPQTD